MKITTVLLLAFVNFSGYCNSQAIKIGTQTWATKNLNVAKFRNGDVISQAKTDEEWEAAGDNKQPAWCYYENNTANGTKYGKLYNWYAVVDYRGLAPTGHHIPTDEEWTVLSTFLGGEDVAGKKMKSSSGWDSYEEDITCANCKSWNEEYRRKKECNVCQDTRVYGKKTFSGNGTNSSGFSGLPGGHASGVFSKLGTEGDWWSASEYLGTDAWVRKLLDFTSYLNRASNGKKDGLSVRCVKD